MNFLGRDWSISEEVLAGVIVLALVCLVAAVYMFGQIAPRPEVTEVPYVAPVPLTKENVHEQVQSALAPPPQSADTSTGSATAKPGATQATGGGGSTGATAQPGTQNTSAAAPPPSAEQKSDISSSLAAPKPNTEASAEEKKNISNALAAP